MQYPAHCGLMAKSDLTCVYGRYSVQCSAWPGWFPAGPIIKLDVRPFVDLAGFKRDNNVMYDLRVYKTTSVRKKMRFITFRTMMINNILQIHCFG
jgi:hypothetical protein